MVKPCSRTQHLPQVRLKPATPYSQVKHSTTEHCAYSGGGFKSWFSKQHAATGRSFCLIIRQDKYWFPNQEENTTNDFINSTQHNIMNLNNFTYNCFYLFLRRQTTHKSQIFYANL